MPITLNVNQAGSRRYHDRPMTPPTRAGYFGMAIIMFLIAVLILYLSVSSYLSEETFTIKMFKLSK